METEPRSSKLKWFKFEGARRPVEFKETVVVTEGVECDVYIFTGDSTLDLGVIRISPNYSTPLQRVLSGDRTIEGYISGRGQLIVHRRNGRFEIHKVGFTPSRPPTIDIEVGDFMQWRAFDKGSLLVYEICYPPYQDGRYESIEE